MVIEWYARERYGNIDRVPKEQEQAQAWQRLTGRKTILNSDINPANTLGIHFKQVIKEL